MQTNSYYLGAHKNFLEHHTDNQVYTQRQGYL